MASTVYYWRVDASNTNGTSAWSQIRNFTTTNLMPAAPALQTPLNNAVGVSNVPRLTWAAVANAATYRVQVATASTFESGVISAVIYDSSVTTAFDSLATPLSGGMVYYWRVDASNTNGTSAWSQIRNFTTAALSPAAPALLAPTNATTGISTTPKLTWSTVANATRYRLQVSTSSMFATLAVNDSNLTVAADSLKIPLAGTTTYYWRVNASNTYGTSAWTTIRFFATRASTGIVAATKAAYVNSSLDSRCVLELYRANGALILAYRNGMSATRDQMIKAVSKNIAKGFYTYRLRINANVIAVGSVIIH
jgi:hypothetical protein